MLQALTLISISSGEGWGVGTFLISKSSIAFKMAAFIDGSFMSVSFTIANSIVLSSFSSPFITLPLLDYFNSPSGKRAYLAVSLSSTRHFFFQTLSGAK
ncbi:hypothetical protein ES703_122411 [subsurface metagenome]